MKKIFILGILLIILILPVVSAHQSGCHRWHSCPPDTGSYICGDLGYCSQCPDNEYCKDGKNIVSEPSYPTIIPTSQPSTEENETKAEQITITGKNETETTQQVTIQPGQIAEINVTIPIECKGTFKGLVEEIIDGDTLVIDGCGERIRLSLVDTPEYYETGFIEAKTFAESLCKIGTLATIDQDGLQPYDKYGRIVAVVFCQNRNLNAELIYNNLAIIDSRFCSTSEFENEDWAKNYGCKINKLPEIKKQPEAAQKVTEIPKIEKPTETQIATQPSNKGFIDIFIEFLMSLFQF